jgi:hypothetical protein
MTYKLTLANQDDTISVDMMPLNPQFTFNISNPIITIPTPTDETTASGAPKFNVYTINIGMLTSTFNIVLKEYGGLGTIPPPSPPVTVHEKLFSLSYWDKKYKCLYVNGDYAIPVQIQGYRVSLSPGAKDIVDHTLTMVLTNSESE